MATASVQTIGTVGQVTAPGLSNIKVSSRLATALAGLLAAYRERQDAEVDRILRQGLAAAR